MTIGFGVTTASFNAVQQNPTMPAYWDRETQPYTATFWFALACSVVSVVLVPFLTLTTQGGKAKTVDGSPSPPTGAVNGEGRGMEKAGVATASQSIEKDE